MWGRLAEEMQMLCNALVEGTLEAFPMYLGGTSNVMRLASSLGGAGAVVFSSTDLNGRKPKPKTNQANTG